MVVMLQYCTGIYMMISSTAATVGWLLWSVCVCTNCTQFTVLRRTGAWLDANAVIRRVCPRAQCATSLLGGRVNGGWLLIQVCSHWRLDGGRFQTLGMSCIGINCDKNNS